VCVRVRVANGPTDFWLFSVPQFDKRKTIIIVIITDRGGRATGHISIT